jgi:hypothetical protein
VRTANGGVPAYTYNATPILNLSAGNYTYSVNDANGCSASNAVVIVVPTAVSGVISSTSATCGGANGTANVSASGGTPGYSYLWMPCSKTTQSVTGLASGNYTVKITDSKGCNTTLAFTIGTANISAPSAISGPVANLCSSTGKIYSISPVVGATSYTWTVPSGASITYNSGTSITVSFGSNFKTSGSICVKANCACNSSSSTCLNVTAAPAKPGAITGATSVCKSQTGVPYSIVAVTGATSYSWTINGGATFVGAITGTSSSVKYTSATAASANINVVAKNSCGSSVAQTMPVVINTNCRTISGAPAVDLGDEASNFSDIMLYPNPANVNLNIHFTSPENIEYSFKLMDVLGNVVAIENYVSVNGENKQVMNLREYAQGVYFLRIERDGNEIKTSRIVVQH